MAGSATHLFDLPVEVQLLILENLDVLSLCSYAATCRWASTSVNDCDILWKKMVTCCPSNSLVNMDRDLGFSWKETMQRNYGEPGTKRQWMAGEFSNIKSQNDLSGQKFFTMSAESWGQILEAELSR